MRNADELGIGEFDPRAGVAIVEQYVDAAALNCSYIESAAS